MDSLIQEFTAEVADGDGHVYLARAIGRKRSDGLWSGCLDFRPRSGRGQPRRTPAETTQPSLDALRYWASGLEPVYLEGALERAIGRSERTRSSR